MQVDIKSPSSVEKKVTIRVPADRLAEERSKVLVELSRYATIKGFRPGKAPAHLIERMYGAAILDEVRQRIFRDTVDKVLEENRLQPVSQPKVDAGQPELGKDYEFTLEFEVRPDFEPKDYTGIEVSKKPDVVSDEDIQKILENLRQRNAVLTSEAATQGLGEGLFFVGSYEGTIGDRKISSNGKDVEMELGSKGQLPGLAAALEGMKAGEKRDVSLTFPADWPDESLRGLPYKTTFTCTGVKRRVLPDLDDEFAKDLELGSLDALKKKVREDLEKAAVERAAEEAKKKLLDKVIESNPIDAPPSLVEAQTRDYIERTRMEFQMRGMNMNPNEEQIAEMRTAVKDNAEKAVKRALILSAIAAKEKIEVPDKELEAEIAKNAEESQIPPEKLRALYEKENLLQAIRMQIRERKTIDFLLEKAKVTG